MKLVSLLILQLISNLFLFVLLERKNVFIFLSSCNWIQKKFEICEKKNPEKLKTNVECAAVFLTLSRNEELTT